MVEWNHILWAREIWSCEGQADLSVSENNRQRHFEIVKCGCLEDRCLFLCDQFCCGTRIDHTHGSNKIPLQGCRLPKTTMRV